MSEVTELTQVVSGPKWLRTKAFIGSCALLVFFFLTGVSAIVYVVDIAYDAWGVTRAHYLAKWQELKGGNTALASIGPSREETIERVARDNKISPDLIRAIIWQESKGDPLAFSKSSCIGLMQILPSNITRGMLRHLGITKPLQAVDETKNIEGGGFIIGWNFQAAKGDAYKALFMYYAGTSPDEKTKREGEDYARAVVNILATRAWVKG